MRWLGFYSKAYIDRDYLSALYKKRSPARLIILRKNYFPIIEFHAVS
jgi:hypothetical protein